MKRKFLVALMLGLAISIAPLKVSAAQGTDIAASVISAESTVTSSSMESTDNVTAPDAVTLQKGWNTAEVNGETCFMYGVADEEQGTVLAAVGMKEIDGKVYLFDENGCMLTGLCEVTDENDEVSYFYFSEQGENPATDDYGAQQYGSIEVEGEQLLFGDENGTLITEEGWHEVAEQFFYVENGVVSLGNGKQYQRAEEKDTVRWLQVKNDWYLVDVTDGHRLSGWQTIDKNDYYFYADTGLMVSGDQKKGGFVLLKEADGSYWYSFQSWGGVRKNGWFLYDKNWYWLHKDGRMQAGGSIEYDGNKYFFANWGGMYHDQWVSDGADRYYLYSWGGPYKNKWLHQGNKWYWLQADGRMLKNDWLYYDKNWYRMKADGTMYASEWLYYDGNWYFFKNWGGMYAKEWAYYDKNWYYFKDWGGMYHDQWLTIGGYDYYFQSWGGRLANTTRVINGKTYTFDANGRKVVSGWVYVDGYRRYRNANGSLSNDVSGIFNPSSKYITVDRIRGITTIYGYNSATGKYDTPIKSMWCSVGNPISNTALGTYHIGWQRVTKKMVGSGNSYVCWASYVSQIYGAVYFHGVASDTEDLNRVSAAAFRALGTPQSHGCVRLAACDAKWIYQNISSGTTVKVGDNLGCPMSNPTRYQWKGGAYGPDPTWSPL